MPCVENNCLVIVNDLFLDRSVQCPRYIAIRILCCVCWSWCLSPFAILLCLFANHYSEAFEICNYFFSWICIDLVVSRVFEGMESHVWPLVFEREVAPDSRWVCVLEWKLLFASSYFNDEL